MDFTDYTSKADIRDKMNEKRDCAVIATALTCQVTYETAHAALKAAGRKDRKGTQFPTTTVPAIKALGYQVTEVLSNRQPNGSRYTPKTIGNKLKEGYYLCRCARHIFAVVNGMVLDHSQGSNRRITQIYEVSKCA